MKRFLPGLFLLQIMLLLPANLYSAGTGISTEELVQKQTKLGDNDLLITVEPYYNYSKRNKLSFNVEITFRGDESGKTIILLPDKFGDYTFDNCIRSLQVTSVNCSVESNGIPNQRVVNHAPRALVTVRYEIFDARKFSQLDLDSRYQPIITENYFHIFGEAFFVLPMTNWNKEHNIKLIWINMPKYWSITNSFGTYKSEQTIKKNIWDFRQAVFMGGSDLRIIPKYVSNYTIYIVLRGSYSFSDSYFADFVWSIINETRNFWNDKKYDDYLITVYPVEGNHSYLSEGRTNSFSLFVGPKKDFDYDFKKMIAREAFQNWLGRTILPEEPSQIVSWFFSGFGEYYARLLLLRSNKISLEEYIEEYNYVLEQYAKSPWRYESSTQINNDFSSDSDFKLLQFYRGDILAHNLNTAIYNYSGGKKNLDDFMLDLFTRTKKEDLQISNGVLSAMIRFYAGEKTLPEIMGAVNSGKPLKPRPDALGRCAVLSTDYSRKFWLVGEQFEIYSYVFNKSLFNQNRYEFMKWFVQKGE